MLVCYEIANSLEQEWSIVLRTRTIFQSSTLVKSINDEGYLQEIIFFASIHMISEKKVFDHINKVFPNNGLYKKRKKIFALGRANLRTTIDL